MGLSGSGQAASFCSRSSSTPMVTIIVCRLREPEDGWDCRREMLGGGREIRQWG